MATTMADKLLHPVPPDNNSDIARWTTEMHPAHYVLKIDSYSFLLQMLEKTGTKCYESNVFEASGQKWFGNSLYPNGDKEKAGKGHISLYLILQETSARPLGWEINAYFKFFVYDQIRDKYLVVQDRCGKVKRFHEMKKERGFAQLLSHGDLYDAAKGYLVEDKCVFGVEIFVQSYTGKGECLPVLTNLSNPTYTWKFTKYSESLIQKYSSPEFTLGNCKWKVDFHPKGTTGQEGKSISIYLRLIDLKSTPGVYAEYMMRIKDQKSHKHKELAASHLFNDSSPNWGWSSYMSINYVEDASKGYLLNDTLIIEVEISRISTLKSFA